MNNINIEEILTALLEQLKLFETTRYVKKCCIGFDGYIDELFKVVKSRATKKDFIAYQTISEFSKKVGAASERSADMEIILQERKIGGNAPITANCLASLGFQTKCIGLLGYPEIHTAFQTMDSNCQLVSFGDPCHTIAFEFNDGKLMFGELSNIHEIDWAFCKNNIGIKDLIETFYESDLIGILNWSATNNMNEIFRGIVSEVFPKINLKNLKEKIFIFDISDPSARSKEDVVEMLNLLGEMKKYTNIMLSVNENELRILCSYMEISKDESELNKLVRDLFEKINVTVLVAHMRDFCIGISKDEFEEAGGFFVEQPKISTGGGDNFNSGFCMGQLLGLRLQHSLMLGSAVSSFYISNGYSPNYHEVINYVSGYIIK